jgi:hypothetical protein
VRRTRDVLGDVLGGLWVFAAEAAIVAAAIVVAIGLAALALVVF